MVKQSDEIHSRCDRDVPLEFRMDLARMIAVGYKDALVACVENFDRSEVHDLLPVYRRALIEGGLRNIARRHGAQVDARTNVHGGAYHSVVEFNEVVFTESAAAEGRGGRRVPQTAIFREHYADGRDQLDFFKRNDVVIKDRVYGLVIHGPRDCYAPAPEFLFFGFPRRDCRGYITKVDLTPLLKQVLAADPSIEQVSPELALKLKDIKKRKEQGEG